MKFFNLFIVMLFGCAFAKAQSTSIYEFNDIQLNILKINNIKRTRCFVYNISRKGKIDSTLVWTADISYDNGDIIEHVQKPSDKFSVFYSLTYNSFKALTKRKLESKQDMILKDRKSEEFDYDSQGRQIEATEYNKDTTYVTRLKKVYDNSGKLIKTMYKGESARLFRSMTEFKLQDSVFYDPDGRINSIQYFGPSGIKQSRYLYSYEGTDEKTTTVFVQSNDIQRVLSQEKYDKNGLLIESLYANNTFSLFPTDKITIEKYYYNANSTLNTKLGYFSGKVVYIYKFYYDN